MGMISGSWGNTKLLCGNHPDMENPPEMIIQSGPSSLFYACPKYHPENRKEDEPPCFNRINLINYEKMLSHMADIIIDADMHNEIINLTNYKFKIKSMDFNVIKHTDDEVIVNMIDYSAIKGSKI